MSNSSRTAAGLVSMLPLELELIERNGIAKGMPLPRRLSNSEATTREYETGDFGYRNTGPDLAISFDALKEMLLYMSIHFHWGEIRNKGDNCMSSIVRENVSYFF